MAIVGVDHPLAVFHLLQGRADRLCVGLQGFCNLFSCHAVMFREQFADRRFEFSSHTLSISGSSKLRLGWVTSAVPIKEGSRPVQNRLGVMMLWWWHAPVGSHEKPRVLTPTSPVPTHPKPRDYRHSREGISPLNMCRYVWDMTPRPRGSARRGTSSVSWWPDCPV